MRSKTSFPGLDSYKQRDVDAFIKEQAAAFESVLSNEKNQFMHMLSEKDKEIARLGEELNSAKAEYAEYSKKSLAISEVLIKAQSQAEDITSKAQAEAAEIIRLARIESDKIVSEAESYRAEVLTARDNIDAEIANIRSNALAEIDTARNRALEEARIIVENAQNEAEAGKNQIYQSAEDEARLWVEKAKADFLSEKEAYVEEYKRQAESIVAEARIKSAESAPTEPVELTMSNNHNLIAEEELDILDPYVQETRAEVISTEQDSSTSDCITLLSKQELDTYSEEDKSGYLEFIMSTLGKTYDDLPNTDAEATCIDVKPAEVPEVKTLVQDYEAGVEQCESCNGRTVHAMIENALPSDAVLILADLLENLSMRVETLEQAQHHNQ